MKTIPAKSSRRPFILAVSAAALLAGLLPARASLLLDPAGGTVLFDDAINRDDLASAARALGFTGNYFGTPQTTVRVITNGNLNFSGNTSPANLALGPGVARIAPLWDDLKIFAGDGSSIIESVSPGIFYAVTWNNLQNFNGSPTRQTLQAAWFGAATTLRGFTFQPDDIVFSYLGPIQPLQGNSATVGLNKGGAGNINVPLPGTTDGLISDATSNLLPAAANGGFVLFRPDGAGSYTPFIAAPVLQNSAPVGMPVDANFIVVENVTTGDSTQSNTIGSVLFAEGAALRVFNTLTVTRNYTQSATGKLQLSLGGTTTFDRVVVGGVAVLDGALEVGYADGFTPKRGQTFQVVTAAGGVSGQFDEIITTLTPLLGLGAIYQSNAVLLTVVQQSFEAVTKAFGGTPNQVSTARALDSVAFGSTVPEFIDFLDQQPIETLPGNLDRIAPEELTAVFNIANALANVQMTNLQRRLEDVRGGSTGFSGQRFALQGSAPDYQGGFGLAGVAGPDGKTGKTCCPMVPAPENRWGFFANGSGEFIDVENTGNSNGYDFKSGGITFGVDYRVCENFAVGFTVGYAHTGADLAGPGHISADGGRIGLYATTFAKGFYLDTAVAVGLNGYDIRRSALRGSAYGDTDGTELDVFVGAGYDWHIGGLTVGPIANFQYTSLDLDGFTERGSLVPLDYGDQSGESIRTTFGVKASYDWKWHGCLIRPQLRVSWEHQYGDTAATVVSSFANTGGSAFTVAGPEIGADSLVVGAGVSFQWSEKASFFLYYDGQFGASNYQANAISGGFRMEF